jgi:putative transposase
MNRRKITYQLYPTAMQSLRLAELLRLHKDLWNAALQERIDAYQ